jgi:hypothetical protein
LTVDRRAALVSNLMVVLCSERDTQPVVNVGTPPQCGTALRLSASPPHSVIAALRRRK